jgi:hypothetical protein
MLLIVECIVPCVKLKLSLCYYGAEGRQAQAVPVCVTEHCKRRATGIKGEVAMSAEVGGHITHSLTHSLTHCFTLSLAYFTHSLPHSLFLRSYCHCRAHKQRLILHVSFWIGGKYIVNCSAQVVRSE